MGDFLRKPHGGQAAAGSELVVEVTPHDEVPSIQTVGAVPQPIERDSHGRFRTSEAARRLAKLPHVQRFVPRNIACDPRFKPYNQRRVDWTKKRRTELYEMSGGVSHGVGAYIVSAGWLFAAGEFAAERAAETGDLEGFKIAAQLTQTARQHDLAAWSLAMREAEARREASPELPPWFVKEPTR